MNQSIDIITNSPLPDIAIDRFIRKSKINQLNNSKYKDKETDKSEIELFKLWDSIHSISQDNMKSYKELINEQNDYYNKILNDNKELKQQNEILMKLYIEQMKIINIYKSESQEIFMNYKKSIDYLNHLQVANSSNDYVIITYNEYNDLMNDINCTVDCAISSCDNYKELELKYNKLQQYIKSLEIDISIKQNNHIILDKEVSQLDYSRDNSIDNNIDKTREDTSEIQIHNEVDKHLNIDNNNHKHMNKRLLKEKYLINSIVEYNNQIIEKDHLINQLNDQISNQNTTIENLTIQIEKLTFTNQKLNSQSTAWKNTIENLFFEIEILKNSNSQLMNVSNSIGSHGSFIVDSEFGSEVEIENTFGMSVDNTDNDNHISNNHLNVYWDNISNLYNSTYIYDESNKLIEDTTTTTPIESYNSNNLLDKLIETKNKIDDNLNYNLDNYINDSNNSRIINDTTNDIMTNSYFSITSDVISTKTSNNEIQRYDSPENYMFELSADLLHNTLVLINVITNNQTSNQRYYNDIVDMKTVITLLYDRIIRLDELLVVLKNQLVDKQLNKSIDRSIDKTLVKPIDKDIDVISLISSSDSSVYSDIDVLDKQIDKSESNTNIWTNLFFTQFTVTTTQPSTHQTNELPNHQTSNQTINPSNHPTTKPSSITNYNGSSNIYINLIIDEINASKVELAVLQTRIDSFIYEYNKLLYHNDNYNLYMKQLIIPSRYIRYYHTINNIMEFKLLIELISKDNEKIYS